MFPYGLKDFCGPDEEPDNWEDAYSGESAGGSAIFSGEKGGDGDFGCGGWLTLGEAGAAL